MNWSFDTHDSPYMSSLLLTDCMILNSTWGEETELYIGQRNNIIQPETSRRKLSLISPPALRGENFYQQFFFSLWWPLPHWWNKRLGEMFLQYQGTCSWAWWKFLAKWYCLYEGKIFQVLTKFWCQQCACVRIRLFSWLTSASEVNIGDTFGIGMVIFTSSTWNGRVESISR